jgi:hypothetical protein
MAKQKNHTFYRRLFRSKNPRQSLADLARENGIDPRRLYSYRSYLKSRQKQLEIESKEPPALLPAFLPLALKPRVNAPVLPSEAHTFDLAIE